MTYSQSPFDDQYGLDEWIRQQAALSDLNEPVGSGLSSPPTAAYQPPPQPEAAPLKLNTGPDWTDALGAGTTALAALADLGLNHGRGTGQILAAGGQFGQARAEQRLKGTQDALAYELKRAEPDYHQAELAYRYANLAQQAKHDAAMTDWRTQGQDYRGREVAVKEQNAARADATTARNTNPQNDYAQQFRDFAYERDLAKPGELDNLSYEQMKAQNPALVKAWEFDHAGEKAQRARAGSIQADLNAAPDTTAVAAGKAGAEAAASAQAQRAATGRKEMGNVDVINADVYSSLGPKQINDANDIARSKVQFEKAMNDMAAVEKRVQGFKIVPGADKASWKTAQSGAIGSLTKLFETGVINEREYKRYVDRIPGPEISVTGLMGETGNVIAATRDELSGIFDAGLSQYGVRGKKASAPHPEARGLSYTPPGPTGLDDNYGQRPLNVPVTPAPKAPIGPASGNIVLRPSGMPDGSFYATDPATGRTKRISAQQAAQIQGGQ